MGYTNVDPITKKVKEYKNQAEWLAAVEKATSKPEPKPKKNMTFAEASKKLREEAGIDLRTPGEKEQIKFDEAVGKVVSAALAHQQQQQATQSSPAKQAVHATKSRCSCHIASQSHTGDCHHQKHSQAGEVVTHSKEGKTATYAVGPVMGMRRVSWLEAQRRLRAAGVEI